MEKFIQEQKVFVFPELPYSQVICRKGNVDFWVKKYSDLKQLVAFLHKITWSWLAYRSILGNQQVVQKSHNTKLSFIKTSMLRKLQLKLQEMQQLATNTHLWNETFRNSRPEMFLQKDVLKICSKFTGKYPYRSAISVKYQSNFIEITLWHGCSPVNMLHIFRTPFS